MRRRLAVPDLDRKHLRDERQEHARAQLVVGIPSRVGAHRRKHNTAADLV